MGPFVAVNCAALTEALLESELFGHVKGAFTGATADKQGLFEAATAGTLFLDELGEIPAGMQAKLLRVLQEHAIRPVGGVRERPVDVRVIAATNRDLEAEVRAGRFREDLYYRVNVFTVEVPPLRERAGDVIVLVEHFICEMSIRFNKTVHGIREDALQLLLAHPWPGNVRELSNCIERAVALTAHEYIEVADLPPNILRTQKAAASPALPSGGIFPDELVPITELEARYIRHVLGQVAGNKTEAARILGIDRRTLHRKLQRMGEPDDDE
jgi:transcriptional regulator with PAS, ATPase and Fis domain